MTNQDMNVELARFEGRKFYGSHTIDEYGPETHNDYPEMKYHSDYNWLMPVWFKFRDLNIEDIKHQHKHSELKTRIAHAICYQGINDTLELIYASICWYNKIQNENNN